MNAAVEHGRVHTEEQETSLSDYIAIISRRKSVFLSAFALILTIAIGLAMAMPPVYRSTATILIQGPSTLSSKIAGNEDETIEQTVDTLVRSLLIKPNLLAIVNKYDLYSNFRTDVTENALARKLEKSISVNMLNPEVANVSKRSKGDKVAMEVAFEIENDPAMAQKVANEITQLFLQENESKRKQITGNTTGFLAAEATKLEEKLSGIEVELTNFKEKNLGLLPQQVQFIVSEQERTERELLGVQQQISAIRASTIQLRGQLAGTKSYIYEDRTLIRNTEGEKVLSATGRLQTLQQEYHSLISKYSSSHPKVKKLKREIESLGGDVGVVGNSPLVNDNLELAEVELAEALQKYSSSHPEVRRLQSKVSRLKSQSSSISPQTNAQEFNTLRRINPVFSSLKSGISSGESELASLNARKYELQGKLDGYSNRMEMAPQVEQEYNRIKRKYDDTLNQLNEVRSSLNDAERIEALESADANQRFLLLEPPELPLGPVKPNRPAIVALGALLGLGIAFAIVMLFEAMDESITGTKALVGITGARPLGTIPVILSHTEAAAYIRRKRINMALSVLAAVVVMVGVIWMFSEGGPLEAVWDSIRQSVEKRMF